MGLPCHTVQDNTADILRRWFLDYACAILRTFLLPRWLGGIAPNFAATGSLSKPVNERNAHHRTPLGQRLYHHVIQCGGWFHLTVIATILYGATIRAVHMIRESQGENESALAYRDLWLALITTVVWPPLRWFLYVLDLATPMLYMLSPPDIPDRDDMLASKDNEQARYPRQIFKETKWSWFQLRLPTLYHLALLYTICALVASQWI